MKKCDYCAKEISYFEQYCDEDCHSKANRFYEISERYEKLFSIVNSVSVFGIPIGLLLFSFARVLGASIACISCFALGIMLILLPFPTEGMITRFKLKKAMKITRIVGLGVILLGFAILGLLFVFLLSKSI